MPKYSFKSITTVPNAQTFIDYTLSKTNRQTPTIVRARWKISSIRRFYMRKIRFTGQNIINRFNRIIDEFPRLDSIHPFYSDLMNVLYDRDHYKIALSQLNIGKQLILNISRDYIKLLKYGDSLYRCKQLKRAALGRMVKIIKQQKSTLLYLEQVRQHISRLPTIDPFNKTLLLIGFPSCGKSSFMNQITNANVEIAPYPFTTKSLYIGHCDYNYCRYQIIDSPGILDRKLSQRNIIEMQTITALAHLNCICLYFIDLSPFSNYSIQQQCKLFYSLKPLFNNKPIIIILNKCDLRKFDQLSNDEKNLIKQLKNYSSSKHIDIIEMSNKSKQNVINVRNKACDILLSHYIDIKSVNNTNNDKIENRLFIANPIKRDNKIREITKEPALSSKDSKDKKENIKQIEEENGGPGVFNFDYRKHWNLKNNEWKFDIIPQFYDGKNISDFYHQINIDKKLNDLENEEKEKLNEFMEIDVENDEMYNNYQLNDDDKLLSKFILRKHDLIKKESSHKRKIRDSRPQIPRSSKKTNLSQLKYSLDDLGINTKKVVNTLKNQENKSKESLFHRRGRSRIRNKSDLNLDSNDNKSGLDFQEISRVQNRSKSKSRQRTKTPSKGISSMKASETAQTLKKRAIFALNKKGRTHESDRRIYTQKPLHLFKGKGHPKGR